MARRYNIFIMSVLAMLVTACSRSLPRSGGRPYEVAVVTADEMAGRVVMREMAACTEYFTDDEQMFALSLSKTNGRQDAIRLARTIIIVDTADVERTTAVSERDVWARPQLVLYVRTPSAARLAEDFKDMSSVFAGKINDFERGLLLERIKGKRNMLIEDSIARYTGMHMYVPADMKTAHAEKGFVWLTATSADEILSLCVYRLHRNDVRSFGLQSLTAIRDSVMFRHIRGFRNDVRWHVTPGTERADTTDGVFMVRSRWELEGDAMGGATACRVMHRGDSVFFAETFLYAPASEKKNKMRRAEGILYGCRP